MEYTLDRNKILFYFTADGRIDFRDLVKDLAGVFRTRIELRQHFPKEPEAARYAALFGGKIGSAKRCLEDAAGRTLLLDALKLAGLAEKQDVYGALALLSKYEKDRAGTQALLGLLLNVCSASLRGSEAAQSPVSPARAARCAGEAGKTARLLAGNVSGKLALTCLAARLTA